MSADRTVVEADEENAEYISITVITDKCVCLAVDLEAGQRLL
jgi:hypothetical protein